MQNAIRELDGVDLKGSRVTIREVKKNQLLVPDCFSN